MTPIEAGEEILRCIDHIQKTFKRNSERESELDKQLCDLEHMLEFTPIDIQRGYKLAKQIQDIQRERRRIKNEIELLRILHDQATNTPTGKKFVNDLTAHLGGAKKRKVHLDNRIYTPRSEAFKEAQNASNADSPDMEG